MKAERKPPLNVDKYYEEDNNVVPDLYISGYSAEKIAKQLGCSPKTVSRILDYKHIPKHALKYTLKVTHELCSCGCRQKIVPLPRHKYDPPGFLLGHYEARGLVWPDKNELGLIYGTILGDTHIGYRTRLVNGERRQAMWPRIDANHGYKQIEYVKHKIAKMPSMRMKLTIKPNPGYGDMWASCCGRNHPALVEVKKIVSRGVNNDWLSMLTEEGIAFWFMDDGSIGRNPKYGHIHSAQIHTSSFNMTEHRVLRRWMKKLGFDAIISTSRKKDGREHLYLRLRKEDAQEWAKRFGKYSIPSMDYKFSEYKNSGPVVGCSLATSPTTNS